MYSTCREGEKRGGREGRKGRGGGKRGERRERARNTCREEEKRGEEEEEMGERGRGGEEGEGKGESPNCTYFKVVCLSNCNRAIHKLPYQKLTFYTLLCSHPGQNFKGIAN